jgi:hypothetical protein
MLLAVASLALAQASLDDRIASLFPSADEMRWAAVQWRTDLSTARQEAKRNGKPLLLWVTRGQPSCDDCNAPLEERTENLSESFVLEKIEDDLIPVLLVTDQVEHGQTPTSAWFVRMAKFANQRFVQGFGSAGLYICGYDGFAHAFHPNRSTENLLQFFEKGLTSFKEFPPEETEIPEGDPIRKVEPGVLTVRVHSRISPLPAGATPVNDSLGRDHIWLYPDEISEMAKSRRLPDTVIARMARFHFVDCIRGLPDHWRANEIKQFDVTSTSNSDAIDFSGEFWMQTSDERRGIRGKFEGRVKFIGERIVEFRAFADCTAWGHSKGTFSPPPGIFPLKIAFREVDDPLSRAIVPMGWFSGEDYRYPSID